MSQTLRHPQILEITRREGQVSVEDLAKRFGVSVQTIRRDLTDLAEAGRLDRVHGGAVLPGGTRNIAYQDRRGLNAVAKVEIARAVAALIPNGASLFLNIGTTTEAVAEALMHHDGLLVVTNNMNVANCLMNSPGCDVIVAGGTVRPGDGGLVGHLTMQVVDQFRLDFAVIGCSALGLDGEVLDFDVAEVSVSQRMMARAGKTILAADGSKFARTAPARITQLCEVSWFVTDDAPPRTVQDLWPNWRNTTVLTGDKI